MRKTFILASAVVLSSASVWPTAGCSSDSNNNGNGGDAGNAEGGSGSGSSSGSSGGTASGSSSSGSASGSGSSSSGSSSSSGAGDSGPDDSSTGDGAADDATEDSGDGASVDSSSGSTEAGNEAGNCVTLTVKDAPTVTPWCNVSVNGQAPSTAGVQTVCVPPGTTVTLSATAQAGFKLGTAPWHDTAGDHGGNGDPGTLSDAGGALESTTTITVTPAKKCVWVCCPSNTLTCPTTDQCP